MRADKRLWVILKNITFKISRTNNRHYPRVLLSKFFCMVFVDPSGKKLDFFTATVFGGLQGIDATSTSKTDRIVTNLKNSPCELTFDISSDFPGVSCNFINLTEEYLEQEDCIGEVWGSCEKIYNEDTAWSLLENRYQDHYARKKASPEFRVNIDHPIYHFFEKKKSGVIYDCIATCGEYRKVKNDNKYILSYSKDLGTLYDGLQIVNWVQSEITLPFSILDENIKFSIQLDKDQIYTPDFTWYFAPPTGYVVNESSYVLVGDSRDENAVQQVVDEKTVIFSQWASLGIEDRKKSRVLFKVAPVTDLNDLSKDETISVVLSISSPQRPTNRQFLIGLLVAFLLSFSSDKTRINDYYSCLAKVCSCKELCGCLMVCNLVSILAPLLILLTFLSVTFMPRKCLPHNMKSEKKVFHKTVYIIGLCSTIFLIVYVYGVWLIFPEAFSVFGNPCAVNKIILFCVALISFATNGYHFLFCAGHLKLRVFNYL